MRRLSLSGAAWSVECARCADARAMHPRAARPIPATVPGCVHHALEAAGIILPVDRGDAEAAQQWVGESDWTYRARFDAPAELLNEERVDLVFEGLDTIAEIRLNGQVVGAAASQFHPHAFSVKHLLRERGNELAVALDSPVQHVRTQEAALGPRPVNGGWTPYPFIRKSACSFGWDWGPKAPSLGVQDVSLVGWSGARIAGVRPLVMRCTEAEARVAVHVRVEHSGAGAPPVAVEIELHAPDGAALAARATVAKEGAATLHVPQPQRWWPRGMGAQHLYDVRVRLMAGGGGESVADSWRGRIGLRSVELDTAPDRHGSAFALRVNSQPVFCVGANWIPVALHPAGAAPERFHRLLELACEANLNMLRVWGGGLYEPRHFYERCDELGLMVWQDFMFACATYPEEEPYPALIEREARHQVERLAAHPSVVLWCGGNEDVIAWQNWGFQEALRPGQSWGKRYWLELLPAICRELDPTRPYWPESPWSGSLQVNANDPDHGDRHTWDLKVEEYRTIVPRFASEFGHQSPPNLCTLVEAVGDPSTARGAELLALRQRAGGGDKAQYTLPLAEHFPPARSTDEWLYQAHLLHARAMELAIAWLRAHRPRCMGALFWQWNDVWAGHSWSAVDAALRPKPVWHAVRRAAAPRMISVQPIGEEPELRAVLVNETDEEWHARVSVTRADLSGRVLASGVRHVLVAPRAVDASCGVAEIVGTPADPRAECLFAEVGPLRGWWMFARDREQSPAEARIRVATSGSGARWTARVSAETLVRDLWLEPRQPWLRCEPNLVTLMPGEECAVNVELCEPSAAEPEWRVHAAGGVVRAT